MQEIWSQADIAAYMMEKHGIQQLSKSEQTCKLHWVLESFVFQATWIMLLCVNGLLCFYLLPFRGHMLLSVHDFYGISAEDREVVKVFFLRVVTFFCFAFIEQKLSTWLKLTFPFIGGNWNSTLGFCSETKSLGLGPRSYQKRSLLTAEDIRLATSLRTNMRQHLQRESPMQMMKTCDPFRAQVMKWLPAHLINGWLHSSSLRPYITRCRAILVELLMLIAIFCVSNFSAQNDHLQIVRIRGSLKAIGPW